MLAAILGQTEIAKVLIARGADIKVKDNNGKTALGLAAQKKNTAIVKYLEQIPQTPSEKVK